MAIQPISFLDYGRVSVILMMFDKSFRLSLVVNMTHKNQQGKITHNINEYYYHNENYGMNMISTKMFLDCWFQIDSTEKTGCYASIYPRDIFIVQKALTEMVLPWFFGDKRIFKLDNNSRLVLKGKYTPVEIPFNNNIFLRFDPIILDYEDGTCKEGVRMTVSNNDCYSEFNINKFLEFYYIIMNTDIVSAALNMINYLKIEPYGINLKNINGTQEYTATSGGVNNLGNFFSKK